jgi:hypothetical protein
MSIIYHQNSVLSEIRSTEFLQKFVKQFHISEPDLSNNHEIIVADLKGTKNDVTLAPAFTSNKRVRDERLNYA